VFFLNIVYIYSHLTSSCHFWSPAVNVHLVLCLCYRVDRQLQQLVREVYMALVDQAMMVTNPCMYVDTCYHPAAFRLWLALMIS